MVLVLACVSTAASAEAPQRARTAPEPAQQATHRAPQRAPAHRSPKPAHRGPQLRVGIGYGGVYAHQGLPGGSDEISGGAYGLQLALGEMVLDSLALQLDFALLHAPGAERGVLNSTRFTALNLGVGLTYWLMPENVYLSGGLGLSTSAVEASPLRIAEVEIPDVEASGVGLGLHLALGKQWWVSRRVGLGLSVSALALTMPNDLGDDADPRRVLGASLQSTLSYR